MRTDRRRKIPKENEHERGRESNHTAGKEQERWRARGERLGDEENEEQELEKKSHPSDRLLDPTPMNATPTQKEPRAGKTQPEEGGVSERMEAAGRPPPGNENETEKAENEGGDEGEKDRSQAEEESNPPLRSRRGVVDPRPKRSNALTSRTCTFSPKF